MRASLNRIVAMLLRYWYLIKGSWPRIFSLMYWPTVSMLMWGFVQKFLSAQGGAVAHAVGFLIGAVILWDVLFRGQLGLSLSFFEEIWSRNLGHLLVSPLRLHEFILALMASSFLRCLISVVPASLLAIVLFDFSIYGMGLALGLFFFSLMMFGWALGLMVAGLVMRFGQSAEEIAWAIVFAILPLCGVYYPTSVLPGPLHALSFALPPKYIFDAARDILQNERFDPALMEAAFGLDLLYLGLGLAAFFFFLDKARERGMLLAVGE
jgi:ABC-2 type transport system permease protein